MPRDKIIAALDIGSAKITTLIASVTGEKLAVIGVASTKSQGIRKGQVVNIEETIQAISESVDAAERMAGVSIGGAYVCIGGAHIASQNSKGVVAVAQPEGEIVEADVMRVIDAARAVSLPSSREILHVLPRDFMVDGQEGIKDPIGMTGVRLEVDTQIVTGLSTAVRNLSKCVNEVGVSINEMVFSGLASSLSVLSKTEKELGVVLVDIGAGTTDIAIWIDGALSYSAVLPVGAKNITNDIAVGLGIGLESAEKIKIFLSQKEKPQLATPPESSKLPDDLNLSSLNLPEDIKKVSRKTLVDGIIKPRLLEIFTFVGLEIQKSNFGGMTPAGVVITGGGAQTNGIMEACRQRLAMPCRIGVPLTLPDPEVGIVGLTDELISPQFATAVGLVIYGTRDNGWQTRKLSSSSLPSWTTFDTIASGLPLKGWLPKIKSFVRGFLP